MFEFFTIAITQPNFDKIPAPKPTALEVRQVRADYKKIATNLPPRIDFKRFLPKKENSAILEAPQIQDKDAENTEPSNHKTTEESNEISRLKLLRKILPDFLKKFTKQINADMITCKEAGGTGKISVFVDGQDVAADCDSLSGINVTEKIKNPPLAPYENFGA